MVGRHLQVTLYVLGFMLYQQYFSYLTARVHKSMFPGLFLTSAEPVHYPDTIGQSYFYSHNPERQEGKPLLPVLKTLRPWIEPMTSSS